jgi:hypothetical protein
MFPPSTPKEILRRFAPQNDMAKGYFVSQATASEANQN